jgi:hypothetical protein
MMQIDIAGPPQRRQAETEARYYQSRTAQRARFHCHGVTLFPYGLQMVTASAIGNWDNKYDHWHNK